MMNENYVNLPQSRYTQFYQPYQSQTGNIAETSNILTQYNQVTKQTNNYDLLTSFPSVLALYQARQQITNQRPIPIYDANAVNAAQRASYAIQQRQFDNNIQSGVNMIVSPQIQQLEQTTKSAINQLNFQNIPQNEPGMIASSPYTNFNPSSSGTLIQTPEGRVIGNRQLKKFNQGVTRTQVMSPKYNIHKDVYANQLNENISAREAGQGVTIQDIANYLTTHDMYPYLNGFKEFSNLNLNNKETYEAVTSRVNFDTYGISQERIDKYIKRIATKYQLQTLDFIYHYLRAIIVGKLNGLDITPVWNRNGYFMQIKQSVKQKLQQAVNEILTTKNLASKL